MELREDTSYRRSDTINFALRETNTLLIQKLIFVKKKLKETF